MLYSTALRGTAPVVRNRGDILNKGNIEAGRLKSPQSSFSSRTGPFNVYFNVLYTMLHRLLSRRLSSNLSSKWRAFSRALEALAAGAGPSNGITSSIGYGDYGVVKR